MFTYTDHNPTPTAAPALAAQHKQARKEDLLSARSDPMQITVLYRESGSGCDDSSVRSISGGSQPNGRGGGITSQSPSNNSVSPADAGYNAFEFTAPPGGRAVTVADVVKAFPLGPSYHFDILRRDGMFESVHALDLGSPVPMTSDGVITCRYCLCRCA